MVEEHELCERAFRYACDIGKLCNRLQERGPVVRRLSMKLLDSGTSIGANLEARRAFLAGHLPFADERGIDRRAARRDDRMLETRTATAGQNEQQCQYASHVASGTQG